MTTPPAGTDVAEPPEQVGILGGTGKLGRGLAVRLARAGVAVRLGSRDAERAADQAAQLVARLPAGAATITGVANDRAVDVPLVIASVPAEAAEATIGELAPQLEGRVLLSAVVPLAFDDRGPHLADVGRAGSFAELLADTAPGARVVAGLHAVSSAVLADLDRLLEDDVPLCGDDADAVALAAGTVATLGVRPVAAGPLRLAASLEALTPLLIAINRTHGSHAGIRLTGL